MKLKTRYLGFELPHPFVLGASPLADDLDSVRRAEDAGVAAIVMHSIFEEQIRRRPESRALPAGVLTPDRYADHLRRVKNSVSVPVIASLNGWTTGKWLEYATSFEQAGADAIELNVYGVTTDPSEPAAAVERRIADMIRLLRGMVRLPIAVKLSPFYTSLPHFVRQLQEAGADGFVLFNRFYQPDIDPENLDVRPTLELSTASELSLRLRWLAILSPLVRGSLVVSGGVHCGSDAVKALMAGAHAVQVVSEVLKRGPQRIRGMVGELIGWLELHEYHSLSQLQGSMNLERCNDASAYERANYVRVLDSWSETPKAS